VSLLHAGWRSRRRARVRNSCVGAEDGGADKKTAPSALYKLFDVILGLGTRRIVAHVFHAGLAYSTIGCIAQYRDVLHAISRGTLT
jgi:hypothetical protein